MLSLHRVREMLIGERTATINQLRGILTEFGLSIIAEALLKVQEDTHELLSSSLDDNYTRATCTFGRQKNRIVKLCMSKKYD